MLVLGNNEYGGNGAVSYLPPDPGSGKRNNLTHYAKNDAVSAVRPSRRRDPKPGATW